MAQGPRYWHFFNLTMIRSPLLRVLSLFSRVQGFFFKEVIHFWYQMACSGPVNIPRVLGYFDFDITHYPFTITPYQKKDRVIIIIPIDQEKLETQPFCPKLRCFEQGGQRSLIVEPYHFELLIYSRTLFHR